MPTVKLPAGTIHYEKSGPAHGRPLVFIHGYAMGSSLWRELSSRLAANEFLCHLTNVAAWRASRGDEARS